MSQVKYCCKSDDVDEFDEWRWNIIKSLFNPHMELVGVTKDKCYKENRISIILDFKVKKGE